MEYRKRNIIFTLVVFVMVGLFSIASISAINYKTSKNKSEKKGTIVVKLKKGKANGKAKIKYDTKKGNNGDASITLEVKKLSPISPTSADSNKDPRYYEGWFILKGDKSDDYEVSMGVFNTVKNKKGKAYFEFKPNKIDEEEGIGGIGHNLSALKEIKITKEANDGDLYRDGDVVLTGDVKFKKNPYKHLYGGKMK